MPHHVEQIRRPVAVQQLCADSDAAGVLASELVGRHDVTLSGAGGYRRNLLSRAAIDRRLPAIPVEQARNLCCAVVVLEPGTMVTAWGVCLMAADDREPQERPGELPRRVPGASRLVPAAASPQGAMPIAPGWAGQLPKRAPGASAIQAPPQSLRRPRLPEPLTRQASATARPSPAALASSAAKLLSGVTAAANTAAPAATAGTGTAGTGKQRANRRTAPARMWHLAGLLIAVLLVAAAVLIVMAAGHSPAVGAGRADRPGYSIRGVIGVASSTVRPTVHRRSCDRRTASGSTARASSPAAPAGNVIRYVTCTLAR